MVINMTDKTDIAALRRRSNNLRTADQTDAFIDLLLDQLEAERPQREGLESSFDELAVIVGFSKERCEQTGDSPMDCARGLIKRAEAAEKERDDYKTRASCAEAERDKNIAWHSKQLKRANTLGAENAELRGKLDNPVVLEYRRHDGFTDSEKVRLINAITNRCADAIRAAGFPVKEEE